MNKKRGDKKMKCDLTKLDNFTEFFVNNGGYYNYILKDGNDTYIRTLVYDGTIIGRKIQPGWDLDLDIDIRRNRRLPNWIIKDYLNHFGYEQISSNFYRKELSNTNLDIELEVYPDDDIELKIWNKELELYITCGHVSLDFIRKHEAELLDKYNIIEKNSSILLAEMAEDIER